MPDSSISNLPLGITLAGTEVVPSVQGGATIKFTYAQVLAYILANIGETVDDRVNGLLVEGDNITLTYNDGAGTLTIAAADAAATNLTPTISSTQVVINSSTGTDATIPGATTSEAGVMSASDKTKLNGIASGATANSSDATLLARANHTGTQLSSTISDFSEAVDDRVGSLLTQGTNVTLVYSDGGNTLTVSAAGTDLTSSTTTTTVTVLSNTGADATLAAATGSAAGVMIAADKTKLDGIASGATANSSDATLLARANHTGTQLLSTISDVTISATNLNILDDGVNTTLHFHDADRARANHTGTQLAATISDFSTATNTLINAFGTTLASVVSGSDGAGRIGFNGALVYTGSPDDTVGALLLTGFGLNAAEVSAGVTPVNYGYLAGDPKRLGAVADWNGSTGTDDTAVFRLLKLVIAAGQKAVYFKGRRYKLSTIANSEILFDIATQNGVTVYFDGAEIVVNRTFTSSEFCQIWRFAACNDVNFVGGVNPRCTQSQPAGQHTSRGPQWLSLIQGCIGFKADTTSIVDFRIGYQASRLTTDPESYVSSNLNFGDIYAYRTGYPLVGSLSGYGVTATVWSVECGRSYFWTGGKNHKVRVFSTDHQASVNCLLATDRIGSICHGMDDVELDYNDHSSTGNDNSLNHVRLEIQDSELGVGYHRNIRIHGSISNLDAAKFSGFLLQVSKVTSADVADTVDRGHVIEGITLSGCITAASSSQRSISFCGIGTWGTGENLRSIRFRDLRFDGTGQPSFTLTSLKDTCLFESYYYVGQTNITGSASIYTDIFNSFSGTWSTTGLVNFGLTPTYIGQNTITTVGTITTGTWTTNTPVTGGSFNPTDNSVPTNGMYLPSANTLGWSTNGVKRLAIDSNGNHAMSGAGTNPNYTSVINTSGQVYFGLEGSGGSDIFSGGSPYAGVFGTQNNTNVGIGTNGATRVTVDGGGQLSIVTVGKGLSIKEGSNAKMGVATLVAGTVTVSNTSVTANSRIHLTIQSLGTVAVPKAVGVTTKTAGVSFVITSADATDTSVILWTILEPA